MKSALPFLIAGSLLLNVLLVGALLAGRNSAPAPAVTSTPSAPKPATPPIVDAQTWTGLHAEDLAQMVQSLREAGFPPAVLRAIVATQLRERYAARLKALDPESGSRPFWKEAGTDPRIRVAMLQLQREQQKLLRDLLGPPESPDDFGRGRRLESVPAHKLDDVRRLLQDADDARQEAFANFSGGMITPDMQKRMQAVEKELQASLATVLTPAELEEYNLRNSDTANQVRYQLAAFDPTEEEFRQIYRLQADFDSQYGRSSYGLLNPEETRRRGEAQRQLNEQIKAALGPVRAAEYERASDFQYRQTSQLVSRLELPPDTTSKVWEVQKDIQGRIGSIFGANPSADERNAKLAELASEAQTRVTALLGTRGYEAYQQFGGSWMQMLRPRPPPTATTPPRQ